MSVTFHWAQRPFHTNFFCKPNSSLLKSPRAHRNSVFQSQFHQSKHTPSPQKAIALSMLYIPWRFLQYIWDFTRNTAVNHVFFIIEHCSMSTVSYLCQYVCVYQWAMLSYWRRSNKSWLFSSAGPPHVILSRKFIEHCILGTDNLPGILLMYSANTPSHHTHNLLPNSPMQLSWIQPDHNKRSPSLCKVGHTRHAESRRFQQWWPQQHSPGRLVLGRRQGRMRNAGSCECSETCTGSYKACRGYSAHAGWWELPIKSMYMGWINVSYDTPTHLRP